MPLDVCVWRARAEAPSLPDRRNNETRRTKDTEYGTWRDSEGWKHSIEGSQYEAESLQTLEDAIFDETGPDSDDDDTLFSLSEHDFLVVERAPPGSPPPSTEALAKLGRQASPGGASEGSVARVPGAEPASLSDYGVGPPAGGASTVSRQAREEQLQVCLATDEPTLPQSYALRGLGKVLRIGLTAA